MLPKIEHPTYSVDLSIGKVTYRPFIVKEQKILMMAHQAQKIDTIVEALKTILRNCIVEPQGLDIDAMPLSDMTLLFIHLRARSVGENMKVWFKCRNQIAEGQECGMMMEDEVNLLEIKPEGGGADPKIMITKDIGVHMHYPSFDLLNLILNTNSLEAEFIVVAGCIDYVFDANGIYKASEASPEEMTKFVTDLPEEKYNILKQFIASAPSVKKVLKKTCVKCGFAHDMVLEGLSDFFV